LGQHHKKYQYNQYGVINNLQLAQVMKERANLFLTELQNRQNHYEMYAYQSLLDNEKGTLTFSWQVS